MILFGVVAAAMTLFALAVLLPVLWRTESGQVADLEDTNIRIAREQLVQLDALKTQGEISDTEYEERKNELELGLASSLSHSDAAHIESGGNAESTPGRGYLISILVAISLPVSAYFLYQKLGTPEALDPEFLASQSSPVDAAGNVASIDELLPRLEAHLTDNPDDERGWRILGVTYLRMQRFADADAALSRALELNPEDPDILLQLADAKAMAAGGQLAGEPEALIRAALAQRPDDIRGMWLMGMLHTQKEEHQAALDIWQRLSPLLADEPEAANEVKTLIGQAQAALGVNPTDQDQGETANQGAEGQVAGGSVAVSVSIDPRISAKLKPEQKVYIYAKAVSGPPMPLAVIQRTVADLPLEITLDKSMAMVAGMDLSQFSEVVVGARVSLSGDPVAGSGDYFAEIQPVAVDSEETTSLTIYELVP